MLFSKTFVTYNILGTNISFKNTHTQKSWTERGRVCYLTLACISNKARRSSLHLRRFLKLTNIPRTTAVLGLHHTVIQQPSNRRGPQLTVATRNRRKRRHQWGAQDLAACASSIMQWLAHSRRLPFVQHPILGRSHNLKKYHTSRE